MILNRLHSLVFIAAAILFSGVTARPQFSGAHGLTKRESAAPELELRTNAARMAAGLGPSKPKRMFDATRSFVLTRQIEEARTYPSGVPQTNYRIRINRADGGQWSGNKKMYVAKSYSSSNRFDGTTSDNSNQHLKVTVGTTSGLTSLTMTNGPSGAYPYLGFARENTNSLTTGYASGSGWYNSLTSTKATSLGAGPSNVGNSMSPGYKYSESTIWSVEGGGQLKAKWVNGAGQTAQDTTVYYSYEWDTLVQTRKTSGLPYHFVKVNLYLV
ncbi:hypothetical protein NLJ89_g6142 [Agrocybe chaxingu]|uniref:Uncharacterized protein n=1 Tax=Agrocybe chaxingu TaxID=84603 RepID=A0A9W8MWA8_9AGAR|nr:hypothetical protein NLJ89_g6142 [Agrocybe chaxingu]